MRVEDYDRAKALKAEIAVLRRNMDARLRPVLASAGLESPIYAPPSPPTTTTTTTLPPQQPQPPPTLPQAAPQEQQPRGYTPTSSYAPNSYDEIPVGGGSAAQQARAAAYAASRSVSSSDAAPHHQVHYASDPVLASSPGGPSGYSATAAGGESGGAGGPAPAASPRKGNAVFDEDAPIVGAFAACILCSISEIERNQTRADDDLPHTTPHPKTNAHQSPTAPPPRCSAVTTAAPTPPAPAPPSRPPPTPAGRTRARARIPWRACRTTRSCRPRSPSRPGARCPDWTPRT